MAVAMPSSGLDACYTAVGLARQRSPATSPPDSLIILSEVRLVWETLVTGLSETFMFARIHGAANLSEAAALIDIAEPAMVLIDATSRDGLAAARSLRQRYPSGRLVAFNVSEAKQVVAAWAEAGIAAYAGLSITLKELVALIGTLMNGETTAPVAVNMTPQSGAFSPRHPTTESLRSSVPLTPREKEVAELIVAGESNKEIARLLNISLPTVKSHVHNLLGKLGLQRRGKLASQYRGHPAFRPAADAAMT